MSLMCAQSMCIQQITDCDFSGKFTIHNLITLFIIYIIINLACLTDCAHYTAELETSWTPEIQQQKPW